MLAYLQPIQPFNRTVRLAYRGPERGKIVPTDQDISTLLHRVQIKGLFDLPDQPGLMRHGRAPGQDTKQILSL